MEFDFEHKCTHTRLIQDYKVRHFRWSTTGDPKDIWRLNFSIVISLGPTVSPKIPASFMFPFILDFAYHRIGPASPKTWNAEILYDRALTISFSTQQELNYWLTHIEDYLLMAKLVYVEA